MRQLRLMVMLQRTRYRWTGEVPQFAGERCVRWEFVSIAQPRTHTPASLAHRAAV